MGNILGIPAWAVRTMLHWVVADFCLDCQVFVLTVGEHCWESYKDHRIIRLKEEESRTQKPK